MKLTEIDYVVVDVETTGLRPGQGDRIIELAAVKCRRGRIMEEFSSLINPQRPVPEETARVHGIDDAMLANAPKAADILPNFIAFIGAGILVGHNIKFDLDFLSAELALAQRSWTCAGQALDTMKMAKHFLPHLGSVGLEHVARHFGILVETTHRALADVRLTAAVFRHLCHFAVDQGLGYVDDAFKLFGVAVPPVRIAPPDQVDLFAT